MTPRAATPQDLPVLARILGDWVAETPWMPRLHSRAEDLGFLQHLHSTAILRVVGDPALGFLARQEDDILALYLAPAARRRGLGRALMDEAKSARPRLALWTFQANGAARAFYAAQGFAEIERGDGSGNAEGLPDLHLMWRRA